MRTTRVFISGNSQAVRLPKEFQIPDNKVEIFRRNNDIIIRLIPVNLKAAFDLLANMPTDFMSDGRKDTPPQKREF